MTIPAALSAHLDAHDPDTRLSLQGYTASPHTSLLNFAIYTPGSRNAEALPKLKAVWQEDVLAGHAPGRSRVIIFANTCAQARWTRTCRSTSLRAKVAVRLHGSNEHLAGFLRPLPGKHSGEEATEAGPEVPHVPAAEHVAPFARD
jgi:hypothetical protein